MEIDFLENIEKRKEQGLLAYDESKLPVAESQQEKLGEYFQSLRGGTQNILDTEQEMSFGQRLAHGMAYSINPELYMKSVVEPAKRKMKQVDEIAETLGKAISLPKT